MPSKSFVSFESREQPSLRVAEINSSEIGISIQEDVNGEKLTVKKNCGFLVPIFSRFTPIFHGL